MNKKLKAVLVIAGFIGLAFLAAHLGDRDLSKHMADLQARQSAHQADLAAHPQDPDPRRR